MTLLFLLLSDLGTVATAVVVLVVTLGALFCEECDVPGAVGLLIGLAATWTCEDTGTTCFF
jgi:hypothetical protein